LIIGNPPYVKKEDILPPNDAEYIEELLLPENEDQKSEASKRYKAELNLKTYETYPFLNTRLRTLIDGKIKTVAVYGDKVSGRSDLYVYFQLLCPRYLNSNGIFCFIISNSWLDVEYGAFVQHFLLKQTRLLAVYDCSVRSFNASVNTVIYLHSALINTGGSFKTINHKTLEPPEHNVRFVMNRADYAFAAKAVFLLEQENSPEKAFQDSYRVIPISQRELYREGYDEEDKKYVGDKWGGKYLRSPEIFFKIIKTPSLISLDDDYFECLGYVHDDNTGPRFGKVKSFIKSVKNASSISLKKHECEEYGVTANGNSRICASILFPRTIGDRHIILYNSIAAIGKEFYRVQPTKNAKCIAAQLNSTIGVLFREIFGITGLGDGGLKFNLSSVKRFLVFPELTISDEIIDTFFSRAQFHILVELGFDRNLPIRNQQPNPLPDRKALDDIIFDELGLTRAERNEVYWSVAELVKQRLDRAATR